MWYTEQLWEIYFCLSFFFFNFLENRFLIFFQLTDYREHERTGEVTDTREIFKTGAAFSIIQSVWQLWLGIVGGWTDSPASPFHITVFVIYLCRLENFAGSEWNSRFENRSLRSTIVTSVCGWEHAFTQIEKCILTKMIDSAVYT